MAGQSPDKEPPTTGAAAAARTRAPVVHLADPGRVLTPAAVTTLSTQAAAAVSQASNGTPGGEVRVRLVADTEMAAAHLKYSRIPGTTDVLTFDLAEGASAQGKPLDVDILICVDEAHRQAAAHDHPAEHELLLYILHGVLHCLGFNDHDEADYQRMHAEEDRILNAIGVGPVFDPSGYPHAPRGVLSHAPHTPHAERGGTQTPKGHR